MKYLLDIVRSQSRISDYFCVFFSCVGGRMLKNINFFIVCLFISLFFLSDHFQDGGGTSKRCWA